MFRGHSLATGLYNPKARVMTLSGSRKYQIKEERDLQKAIISIQSFANNMRDSFNYTTPITPSYFNGLQD